MNYQRHYDALIDKAKCQEKIKFKTNSHHILPKCLGGSDDSNNRVHLTHRQHFIAHLLLHKIHPENYDLARAVTIAGRKGGLKVRSRLFAKLLEFAARDEIIRSNGRRTIANARKAFFENKEAFDKHKKFMSELGRRIGSTIGAANIKGYWKGKESELSVNGSKGARKLNELINESVELQARRREHGLKGNQISSELWKIPEYREARKNKDKAVCERIKREYRDNNP